MGKKLEAGQAFPPVAMKTIHGADVSVPSPGATVHLQFRRFAGCPICNLHLQTFVRRAKEVADAGIREVVVFHSSDAQLLPFQGSFPFDVVGDPQKKFYRQFGVESSLAAIFNPAAWPVIVAANKVKEKPSPVLLPTGGVLGLPADFLIAPDGTIKAAHYGKHAADQWSLDEVLALNRG